MNPGEPTEVRFPGMISGGFKKKSSSVSIDRKDSDLIIFAQDNLPEPGEVIIVRLDDGRSFSMRIKKAGASQVRDDVIQIDDTRPAVSSSSKEEDDAQYKDKNFPYAPPSVISGLMREMVLAAEFGKASIPGYRISDRHKGENVLNDGTLVATIDRIYIGPNLWGYVLDVENVVDQTQKLNPATFRIDGTRAVSAKEWELAPRPQTVEQRVAGKHKTKLYIVTKSK